MFISSIINDRILFIHEILFIMLQWVNLENMLGEISQTQRPIYYMIPLR